MAIHSISGFRGVAIISASCALMATGSTIWAVPVDYQSVVLANNPRGYFRLGEAPGATTAVNDPGASGGAAMNGTYVNSPTLGVPGIPGAAPNTAVTFNAASGQQVSDIMDSNKYSSFTLEAWVRPSSASLQGIIVYTDSLGSLIHYSNSLKITNDGAPRFEFYVGGISNAPFSFLDLVAAHSLTVGDLYHVVGTAVDGGAMNLYVNGVLEGTASLAGGNLWKDGDRWVLGAGVGSFSPAGFLDGSLDEVAIYPTILTQSVIQAHYAAGLQLSAVPEIDPAGLGAAMALVTGAMGLLERRRAGPA